MRVSRRRSVAQGSLALVVALACGESPGGSGDASPDGGDAGTAVPTPPAPPTPPRMEPCPEGWRTIEGEAGVVECDPWPEGGPQDCPMDQAHFPGGPGCEPIGTPCGEDDWATDLPGGHRIYYVKQGAAPGGTGTRASPFATIADALAVARAGNIVALSKGTFAEQVFLREAITLWGACVGETALVDPIPEDIYPVVSVVQIPIELRNLRIEGHHEAVGVSWGSTGPVVFQSLLVLQGSDLGALNIRKDLVARELVVRSHPDIQRDAPLPVGILPVTSDLGAEVHVDLERCVFEGLSGVGVYLRQEQASLRAKQVAFRSMNPPEDTRWDGYGLRLRGGSRAELDAVVFEGSRNVAITVEEPDTNLTARHLVVRGTRTGLAGRFGTGIQTFGGASVQLERAVFEGNHTTAFTVLGADLDATDIVVRDTESDDSGRFGYGLGVDGGAVVRVRRAHLEGNGTAAIAVTGADTTFSAIDLVVVETHSERLSGNAGEGLQVFGGARADLARASFERCRSGGISVFDDGTSAAIDDLVLRETLAADCAEDGCAGAAGGNGLSSFRGAHVDVSRFRISDNALCGVRVVDAALDLHEGEVSRNLIGANVDADGFDIGRLGDRVLFRDNERTLDTVELPVPVPAESVGTASTP